MAEPFVSIIVPALNEAGNLPALARRLAAAMGPAPYEILIVDDNSADGTPDVCASLAGQFPLRLIVRPTPRNGLSGAVLEGMAAAKGDILVVMDADLQHPPEKVPELIRALDAADFALGSRYVAGASTAEQWSLFRRLNSFVATLLARPFAGRVRDPMSGFFALRRATFDRAERLTPLGYKIALELMCKCRVASVTEIPIHFSQREAGESKLSLRQQFRYLEHLSRLYDFTYPRLSPATKFAIVIALGLAATASAYAAMVAAAVVPAAAVVMAYGWSVGITAVFHARYISAQREFLARQTPWLDFLLIAAAEWGTVALVAWWAAARLAATPAEMLLLPFFAATIVRYVLRKELMADIRGLRRDGREGGSR